MSSSPARCARTLRHTVVNSRHIHEWRVFAYTTASFEAYWEGMQAGKVDDLAGEGNGEAVRPGEVKSPSHRHSLA